MELPLNCATDVERAVLGLMHFVRDDRKNKLRLTGIQISASSGLAAVDPSFCKSACQKNWSKSC